MALYAQEQCVRGLEIRPNWHHLWAYGVKPRTPSPSSMPEPDGRIADVPLDVENEGRGDSKIIQRSQKKGWVFTMAISAKKI